MKRENFYRRDPGAALSGMTGMTLEERGVYNTVIDLLYLTWRPLDDNPAYIAAHCGCAVQKLNPILRRLIEKGKLVRFEEDGHAYLSNPAFERERVAVKGSTDTRSGRAKGAEKSGEVGEKSPGVREKSEGVEENPLLLDIESQENQGVTALDKTRVDKTTPIVPKGTDGFDLLSEEPEPEGLFDRAWSIFPDVGRKRSSKPKSKTAWPAAAKAAGGGARLLAAVERFAASEDATREGGQFVKAFDRWLRDGRWEHWLPAIAPEPTAPPPPSPWLARCREFSRNGYWNTTDWGPKPGKPGCPAPAEFLEQFGLPPTPAADVLPFERKAG